MATKKEKELSTIKLMEFLLNNSESEYGAEFLHENVGLSSGELSLAVNELKALGVVFVQRAQFAFTHGFVTITVFD